MQRAIQIVFFFIICIWATMAHSRWGKKKFELPKTSKVSNMQHEYQNQKGSVAAAAALKRIKIKIYKKLLKGCGLDKSWYCVLVFVFRGKRVQQINAQQQEREL